MMLRDYQIDAIDQIYEWMAENPGNPCVVLPTGAGKSHIIAAFCQKTLTHFPDTVILMLTHVKELIEQNAEKLLAHWPEAPLGIYSASVGKKQIGERITFAGIQSVRTKFDLFRNVDLIIIDECHLVNHKDEGGYRSFISAIKSTNPHLRVIGLTATPYRLGHGMITDEGGLFNGLIEPVKILDLIKKGFLSDLRSKLPKTILDVSNVNKKNGEYIASELQAAVNVPITNNKVIEEIISLAGDRKAWLLFCAGVDHAKHIAKGLNDKGIPTGSIFGETPKKEREDILNDFKSGRLKALTNANVLTTGFDYPDIDLIAMLRATMSVSLYVQMAGRGLRKKSHTDHCLVLDFAGVVAAHGPITHLAPPDKKTGNGEPPTKTCSKCDELCFLSARICPACGYVFPPPRLKLFERSDVDILGLTEEKIQKNVFDWHWQRHQSKTSNKKMLRCLYYTNKMYMEYICEYVTILSDGWPGKKARQTLESISKLTGIDLDISGYPTTDSKKEINENAYLNNLAFELNRMPHPTSIVYVLNGKFPKILTRSWT
jgi:DNA repair protein RadD